MRALAVDDDREIAGPAARAGQRAVGERGLVGQRRDLAARQFGDQRGGREGSGLLVRIDHHVIADPARQRRRLDRLQRGQHQREPALHVGDAGAVERVGVEEMLILKRMIDRIDRVHMPGEQHPHRRVGPHAHDEVPAMLDRADRCRRRRRSRRTRSRSATRRPGSAENASASAPAIADRPARLRVPLLIAAQARVLSSIGSAATRSSRAGCGREVHRRRLGGPTAR